MRARSKLFFLGFWICAVGLPMPAFAHRLNAGLSIVENASDGTQLEITHRLFAHDLAELFLEGQDVDWHSQALKPTIKRYALDHFVIGYDGKPVQQTYVGAERDGEYIYIYCTAPLPGKAHILTIWNTLLQDILPDQKNLTNVRVDGTGNTLSVYSSKQNPAKNLVLGGS